MITEICTNKKGHNLNCRSLGGQIGVSKSTAHRMLKMNKFQSVKELVKPRLTKEIKKA
jgi:hypothetical protein